MIVIEIRKVFALPKKELLFNIFIPFVSIENFDLLRFSPFFSLFQVSFGSIAPRYCFNGFISIGSVYICITIAGH